MTEQYGDALDWHPGQKQLNSERVAEAMCNSIPIALRDFGQVEYRSEFSLPILDGGFQLALAGPEVEFRCDAGRGPKRLHNRIRQHRVDGRTCLGCVEKKLVAFQTVVT